MIFGMIFDASRDLLIFLLHDAKPYDVSFLRDGLEICMALLMWTRCGQLIDLQMIWELQHQMLIDDALSH